MSHTLRVVCPPAIAEGFSLAGIHAVTASDPVEAAAVLTGLLERPEVGVLFVEENLYSRLSDSMRENLERIPLPVVVPFPGPRRGERPSAEDALVETLRLAIGYRLRLR
jgi:vacuolar-type H+-ATPase subunit F/Vma7